MQTDSRNEYNEKMNEYREELKPNTYSILKLNLKFKRGNNSCSFATLYYYVQQANAFSICTFQTVFGVNHFDFFHFHIKFVSRGAQFYLFFSSRASGVFSPGKIKRNLMNSPTSNKWRKAWIVWIASTNNCEQNVL